MMLTKHVFVQNIDKVYINIKTKEMFVRFSNRFSKFFSRESSQYYWSTIGNDNLIDKTTFELSRGILNEKNDLELEKVSKFENQKKSSAPHVVQGLGAIGLVDRSSTKAASTPNKIDHISIEISK